MFESAKLKVKRADQHIRELDGLLQAFVKTDFCRFSIEKEPDTSRNVLKFQTIRDVPDEIPLVLGDAAHNLRAALDLCACEIVRTAGETPSKWTYFPFRETRQEVIGAIKGGQIQRAGTDIVDVIVDAIKPYKGGNDPLWNLHSLDILDKHRLLIPTFSVAALLHVNAKISNGAGFNVTMTDCTLRVGAGGELNIIGGMPGDVQIEGGGQPAFAIFFGKDQPFQGQPLIPTIHQLSQLVSGVIDTLEQAYLARTKSAP